VIQGSAFFLMSSIFSAALSAALLGLGPEQVVGRGAGLSDA
jgi:hypothetical protein